MRKAGLDSCPTAIAQAASKVCVRPVDRQAFAEPCLFKKIEFPKPIRVSTINKEILTGEIAGMTF